MNESATPPAGPDPHAALRQRAERRRLVAAALPPDASPEVQRLVQELQVHQIELEMQNEELLLAQAEAEAHRLQYVDLYDFAPVGYCTLDAAGTISQLNLRTSHLLGQERQRLLGRRLALFVAPAERNRFAEFVARLWACPGQLAALASARAASWPCSAPTTPPSLPSSKAWPPPRAPTSAYPPPAAAWCC